jgi:nitroreductase
MDALLAIKTRQSVGVVRPDAIPKYIIENLLTAGAQAPNHYKVRPWRFFVITGTGLNQLGEIMAKSLSLKSENLPAEALDKERSKPHRAPLIIAVGVDKPTEAKVTEIENLCAAAAACQNILIAAHALGLAAIWRTGPNALDPLIKEFLGLESAQRLIGFLYIGFPQNPQTIPERPDFSDRTVWIGEHDQP